MRLLKISIFIIALTCMYYAIKKYILIPAIKFYVEEGIVSAAAYLLVVVCCGVIVYAIIYILTSLYFMLNNIEK